MYQALSIANYPLSIIEVFNPTRSQVAFFIAVVGGLIVGKLIKNFKIGMLIAIIFGLLLAFSWKRKR